MAPFTFKKGEVRYGNRSGSPPGPVVTYRISPEEIIAKYGPPKRKKKKNTWSDLFYEKTSRTGKKGSASNESSASV